MKQFARQILRRAGFDLVRHRERDPFADFPELTAGERAIVQRVRPFTMTSVERLAAVIAATKYLVQHRIPGDIVECGVWRGGSSMAAALTLLACRDTTRRLWLFDTFEGMPPPTTRDRSFDGHPADALLQRDAVGTGNWCYASLEDVRANLAATGFPSERIEFVRGKVEETIPRALPSEIALLRLDTDWYESTRHELLHLYPKLSPWGVLIVDDYGHWQGARQAVDEFLPTLPHPAFLQRIDYTGRMMIKPGAQR